MPGTASLAKEAAALFHSRAYAECLTVLSQLLHKTDDDPKVLHNIAVVEYLHGGCKDPHKLLDVFSKVKRKTEELSRSAASEQFDASTSGPRVCNATPGGNTISEPGGLSSGSTTYMEGHDTSILTLNTAIVLYCLRQYATSLSVLEPLYRNIEPVDEFTALHIYLLMMDIHMACRQPRKAAGVLNCMEKSFFQGVSGSFGETKGDVTSVHAQQSEGVAIPNVNTPSMMPSIPTQNTDPSLTRTSSEEVLDEEALSLGLDIESSHAARSTVITPSSSQRHIEGPSAALKLLLHFCKVRLFLQTQNLKATKREVKIATNLARGGDYITALLLKAQLEYLRENYRKSMKLLTTSNKEPGMKFMVLNNLGCIYHQLRKHNTAAFYFLKALQCCESTGMGGPISCQDRSLGILYNAGMEQLSCGNPILAFHCFQEAGRLYYNQPLLWLRLAECCFVASEKGLLVNSQDNLAGMKDEVKIYSFGEGKWQRLVLIPGGVNRVSTGLELNVEDDESGELKLGTSSETADFFVPDKPHQPSLVLARMFLSNALYLLDRRSADAVMVEAAEVKGDSASQSIKMVDSKDGGNGEASQASSNINELESKGSTANDLVTPSILSYEDGKKNRDALLRQYILVDMIFVELCLQNPLKAFKTAEILLQQPDCIENSKFLGQIYAAEALCMLNRPTEAANLLSTCLSNSNILESLICCNDNESYKLKDGDNSEASGDGDSGTNSSTAIGRGQSEVLRMSSLTVPRARLCLYVNLAAAYAMQGDLEQAYHCATKAISITPVSPVAILSIVYVELLRGQTQEAVKMLKQYQHLFCRINHMNSRPT